MNWNKKLIDAIRSQDKDAVIECLQKGASAQSDQNSGHFPMHTAAQFNNMQAVGVLHQHGALINEDNNSYQSPLHIAATYGSALTLKKLLSLNASTNRVDRNGNTALH